MEQGTNSGFGAKSTAEEVTQGIDASGLTAIVTGEFSRIALRNGWRNLVICCTEAVMFDVIEIR